MRWLTSLSLGDPTAISRKIILYHLNSYLPLPLSLHTSTTLFKLSLNIPANPSIYFTYYISIFLYSLYPHLTLYILSPYLPYPCYSHQNSVTKDPVVREGWINSGKSTAPLIIRILPHTCNIGSSSPTCWNNRFAQGRPCCWDNGCNQPGPIITSEDIPWRNR